MSNRPSTADQDGIPVPFPLVRYYTAASVIVILVALAVVNLISARVERRTVIERLRQESAAAANPLTFAVSEQMSIRAGVFGYVNELETTQDQGWTERTILTTVRGQPIVRFDILLPEGSIVYSTDKSAAARSFELSQQGKADRHIAAAASAASGLAVVEYFEDVTISLASGSSREFDVVEAFVPVYSEGAGPETGAPPYAVFAIFRDVTDTVAAATSSVARFRLLTVGLTMGGMFVALLWIVNRGQRFTREIRNRLVTEVLRQRDLATELDSQNQSLVEANQAKSRFLSMVSHELKTPLTSVLAFTDIIKRNRDGNLTPRQITQLESIRRNGNQLRMLIEDLLDLSRIDSGTLKLEFAPVPVGDFLRTAAQDVTPILDSRRQVLDVRLPAETPVILADRARMTQVVANLLSNASKYSPEGAKVALAADFSPDAITISVTDTGIGISEEDQKQLFTAFFRADNPDTRKVSGTGLGLVIVRSIVQMHGGTIACESEAGKGSTFTFVIPSGKTAISGNAAAGDSRGQPGDAAMSAGAPGQPPGLTRAA